MRSPAVFLDRDGTIIEDYGYMGDPGQVELLPGAADAIRRCAHAGLAVVVASNQSGVARGMFSEDDLAKVHDRLVALLAGEGATLDGAYYCPYLAGEAAEVEAYRRDSNLRKPEPGMLLQAAEDLDLDLSRSWMIGDSAADVGAGSRAGCRTILIADRPQNQADIRPTFTARTLGEAVDIVEREMSRDAKPQKPSTPEEETRIIQLLEDIRDRIDRAIREQRQQDFSFVRLLGALLQMFAVVAALWGVAALLGDDPVTAMARMTFACFLQLATIFAFASARWR